MHFYENSPITTGAIDYYANRLYNDSVVSRGGGKIFCPPPDSIFEALELSGKGLCAPAQQGEAGLYHTADKANGFLLAVFVIALHDHMHQPV